MTKGHAARRTGAGRQCIPYIFPPVHASYSWRCQRPFETPGSSLLLVSRFRLGLKSTLYRRCQRRSLICGPGRREGHVARLLAGGGHEPVPSRAAGRCFPGSIGGPSVFGFPLAHGDGRAAYLAGQLGLCEVERPALLSEPVAEGAVANHPPASIASSIA